MTIMISPELVPLLRDGLYFDLHGHLEEMASAIEPRGHEDICEVVNRSVERANGAFALFDVVGWVAPAQERAVEVDVVRHRDALLRALSMRLESDRDVQEDVNASEADRLLADASCEEIGDLIALIAETPGIGPVTVPGSFVDLLREALLSQFADWAEKIADAGHSDPGGIDERLLEAFDSCRALLEQVGWVRATHAAPVEVECSAHRRELVVALRRRLDAERYIAQEVSPKLAQYRAERIQAFLSTTGLESEGAEAERGSGAGARDCAAWGCE
jgi:hypothetical protein